MPTTRPRHLVTETDELAAALDAAAERWPGSSRAQLLLRLAMRGHEALTGDREQRRLRRLEALDRLDGRFTDCYGPGYVERLREDWPA